MKINRDGNGNITEVIFAEGEDQSMAWSALQNLEAQRQFQESMKRLSQPMPLMGGMGMGMPMGGGMGFGMMPMMGMGRMSDEQFKEYQKQSEENFKRYQERMAEINKETNEQLAAINRQTAQQVDELAKHAAEYAFGTPQPQNAEKN